MTLRNRGPQVGAARPFAGGQRPIAALLGAALLLLSMVAGVGGVGGLVALGKTSTTPVTAKIPSSMSAVPVAAASTIAVPVVGARGSSAPALGASGSRRQIAGLSGAPEHGVRQVTSASYHLDAADLPITGWRSPARLVHLEAVAEPAVIALTIQVSHRGRAPPAGSLLT